jgi:subfamily B ATP-binding cassette protein MsbA
MSGLHLYRRLLRYVRPYWWAFGFAVLGMVVVALGDMVMAWLIIPIVQNFQNPDPGRTRWLPFAVVAVFLLRGAGSYVSDYGMAWTGFRVVFDLRRELIDKLLRLPTQYFDQNASGVVQSKLTFDAHQLASAASGAIATGVRGVISIVASLGYLMWLNWRLTLMVFIVVPVVAVIIRYFSRRLRRVARDIQSRTGALTHTLEEMIAGHRIVRVFGGESYERERAVAAANALRAAMSKQSRTSAASSPLTVLLAAGAVGFIIWIALQQSQTGGLDVATFLSYTVALIALLDRLKSISGINATIQRGLAAAESIFGLLDREDEPDTGTITLARARRAPLRPAVAALRRRARGTDRHLADGPSRRDRRAGRRVGQRQDLAGQSRTALLRAYRRALVHRRPRRDDADALEPARANRHGVAGRAAVQ